MRVPPPSDGSKPRTSSALALILVLALAIGVWLLNGRDPGTSTATDPDGPGGPGAPTSQASSSAGVPDEPTSSPTRLVMPPPEATDLESGLPFVDLADLPPEATDTVELIDAGPPYPYDEDGSSFGNYEGLLPDQPRGYYEEFTVETPGLSHRGPLRIVVGDEGQLYWTEDHYASFERIRR